jgi:hypothetical protein
MGESWRGVGVSARRPAAGRAAAIAAMALGLGITGVACGGGSSSSSTTSPSSTTAATTASAAQWIGQVCGSLLTWKNDLQAKTNSFQAQSNQFSDLQQAKSGLTSYLGGAVQSTNTMISGLQAAGPAPTKDGAAVSQALVGGFQQFQVSFQQAQTQAQALPTDDPTAFQNQAKSLGTSLESASNTAGNNIESELNKYPTDNLDQQYRNSPTCQQFSK